jgi:hypothetical protein
MLNIEDPISDGDSPAPCPIPSVAFRAPYCALRNLEIRQRAALPWLEGSGSLSARAVRELEGRPIGGRACPA